MRFTWSKQGFEDAIAYLKSKSDPFYKGKTRYDTLSSDDKESKSAVLHHANRIYEDEQKKK